jgi:aryl-alcohol dehydrogenase-like predicted oxidoreductase
MARISRRTFVEAAAAAAGTSFAASVAGRLELPVAAAAAIPTRPFGRSGVRVSIAGLGGGARFYEPVPTDELGAELVRQAIDRGISFIETCANYGPDDDGNCSERRIGMAMKTHRAKAFLETKTDERTYDGAMREMERSLKLLCTDRIDLMLHHNLGTAEELDQLSGPNGAERAIRKMVDEKVVRFRGFSCHNPRLTMRAIARLAPDAFQAPINATRIPDFEAEVLPLAALQGIAVVVMKSVGHGFFLKGALGGTFDSRSKIDPHPEQHQFAPPAEAFDHPVPTPAEYLRYAMSLSVTTVLAGMDSAATLSGLSGVAAGFKPATRAEAEDIHKRAQVFSGTGYWIPRPA